MNTIQEQPTVSNGRVEPPACSDEGVGIGEYPLSFAQEGLWFLEQYAPGIPAYNVPEGWWISGPLDRIALEKSLEAVCRRQEALRTGFRVINEKPTQVIFEEPRLQFRFVDASEAANPRATALMEAEAEVKIPFDLKNGTLFRTLLVRLGEEEHLVVFTLHHIVSDAWSMGILLREIAAQYRAYVSGAEAALPALTIQFADYCEWRRQVWQRGLLKEQQSYWEAKLRAPLSTVDLPKDFPRPSIQTFKGATQFSEWPSPLTEKLRSFSREHGVTLFTTLLTAFKVLLHRYTRQDDIIVGSPFAGRERLETEALIGFFANTLPLRTNLDGNPSFSETLQRVRETVVEAQGHSDMPLEKMVAGAAEQRDLSRSSIFQVVFGLQGDFAEGWDLPKTKTTRLELETGTAKFDWTILATESKAGLRFR